VTVLGEIMSAQDLSAGKANSVIGEHAGNSLPVVTSPHFCEQMFT
jgi:hypothetical protein